MYRVPQKNVISVSHTFCVIALMFLTCGMFNGSNCFKDGQSKRKMIPQLVLNQLAQLILLLGQKYSSTYCENCLKSLFLTIRIKF